MDKNRNIITVLTERQNFWLKHFRSCEAFGDRPKDYAKKHGLNINTFHTMRRRLRRLGVVVDPLKNEGGLFKKIPVKPKTDPHPEIRLHLPNGVCVELNTHFDAATFPTFLQTAAQL